MPVKIRLQRRGRTKIPFYHIIVADSRAPRDGRFIEKIGTYNPMSIPATIILDRDRAYEWLMNGAQPSDTVRAILRLKGVLYKKHLMVGVKKGALSEEEAEAKWKTWVEAKDEKIRKRFEKSENERESLLRKISGIAPPIPEKKVEEELVEEKSDEKVKETPTPEKKIEEEPVEEKADEKVKEPVMETQSAEPEKEELFEQDTQISSASSEEE